MIKTGVVLISHGSKLSSGNDGLFQVAGMLRSMNRWDVVEAAFLQLAEPGFPDVVKKSWVAVLDGLLLCRCCSSRETTFIKTFPEMLELEQKKYPRVEFIYSSNIGADERIALIAADRIHEVLVERNYGGKPRLEQPQAIVEESFDIIDKLVDLESVPKLHRPVIQRAIHATGDTEYAYNLIFHPDAVKAGIRALKSGKNIVTDVNMVKSGISKSPVEKFGGKLSAK